MERARALEYRHYATCVIVMRVEVRVQITHRGYVGLLIRAYRMRSWHILSNFQYFHRFHYLVNKVIAKEIHV